MYTPSCIHSSCISSFVLKQGEKKKQITCWKNSFGPTAVTWGHLTSFSWNKVLKAEPLPVKVFSSKYVCVVNMCFFSTCKIIVVMIYLLVVKIGGFLGFIWRHCSIFFCWDTPMDLRFAGLAKAAYLPPGSKSAAGKNLPLPGPRTGTPLEIAGLMIRTC